MSVPFGLKVRQAALDDIVKQSDRYRSEANEALVARWNAAVKTSIHSLRQMPERGAFTTFSTPHLHDLRRIPVAGFRRIWIFYSVNKSDRLVTIAGVLHASRDSEAILSLPRD